MLRQELTLAKEVVRLIMQGAEFLDWKYNSDQRDGTGYYMCTLDFPDKKPIKVQVGDTYIHISSSDSVATIVRKDIGYDRVSWDQLIERIQLSTNKKIPILETTIDYLKAKIRTSS